MFFEKWFDRGDLIMYSPREGFACYYEEGNMSTLDYRAELEISVFLSYPNEEGWDICEIYIVSKEKIICVSQQYITLLSKNTELYSKI